MLSFIVAGAASAQFGMMGNFRNFGGAQSVDSADIKKDLQEIYQSQNINSADQLNCGKISDVQFEKVGDAYMELIHPGQAHVYMEQMMGGENSASLKQAHINMGHAYTGCWSGYNSTPLLMPMMGGYGLYNNQGAGYFTSGMMGPWLMSSYNWFSSLTMILFWVLLILGLVAIIKQLFKKS